MPEEPPRNRQGKTGRIIEREFPGWSDFDLHIREVNSKTLFATVDEIRIQKEATGGRVTQEQIREVKKLFRPSTVPSLALKPGDDAYPLHPRVQRSLDALVAKNNTQRTRDTLFLFLKNYNGSVSRIDLVEVARVMYPMKATLSKNEDMILAWGSFLLRNRCDDSWPEFVRDFLGHFHDALAENFNKAMIDGMKASAWFQKFYALCERCICVERAKRIWQSWPRFTTVIEEINYVTSQGALGKVLFAVPLAQLREQCLDAHIHKAMCDVITRDGGMLQCGLDTVEASVEEYCTKCELDMDNVVKRKLDLVFLTLPFTHGVKSIRALIQELWYLKVLNYGRGVSMPPFATSLPEEDPGNLVNVAQFFLRPIREGDELAKELITDDLWKDGDQLHGLWQSKFRTLEKTDPTAGLKVSILASLAGSTGAKWFDDRLLAEFPMEVGVRTVDDVTLRMALLKDMPELKVLPQSCSMKLGILREALYQLGKGSPPDEEKMSSSPLMKEVMARLQFLIPPPPRKVTVDDAEADAEPPEPPLPPAEAMLQHVQAAESKVPPATMDMINEFAGWVYLLPEIEKKRVAALTKTAWRIARELASASTRPAIMPPPEEAAPAEDVPGAKAAPAAAATANFDIMDAFYG